MILNGLSMDPLLPDQCELELKPLISPDNKDLNIGDIVLYKDQDSNEYIAHRIVSLNPLMTKGDNSLRTDKVSHLQIIAIVKNMKIDGNTYSVGHRFINYGIAKLSLYSSKTRAIRYPYKVLLYFIRLFRAPFVF